MSAARSLARATGMSSRRMVQSRSGLAFTAAFYVIVVAVLAGLWRAAARGGTGTIVGYDAVALTWYIAASEAVTISLNARLIDDVGRDIASGAIAIELLRPASVLAHRVATELGTVLPRVALCCGVGTVLATVTAGAPPRPLALVFAVPGMILAVTCNIVAQHAFAASAFWLRNAGSAWFLYQKLVFVIGGMLLPLEVLPAWLHRVANVLPFRAMAYIPARLASGHVEPSLLLQQIGWLVVLAVAAAAVFGAGERRLQVVGG